MTSAMKLYHIYPLHGQDEWDFPYNKYHGHVICAECATDARNLAAKYAAEEGSEVWTDPSKTVCEELVPGSNPGIIISDFNAA